MIVVLDAGVAGGLARAEPVAEVHSWIVGLISRGRTVCLPEIVDYELRRAFLLERLTASIRALDQLPEVECEFVPLTSPTMRRAAQLWAELRRIGQPTAANHVLDADCILAAQAQLRGEAERRPVVIATTNVKHLSRMVDAKIWSEVV